MFKSRNPIEQCADMAADEIAKGVIRHLGHEMLTSPNPGFGKGSMTIGPKAEGVIPRPTDEGLGQVAQDYVDQAQRPQNPAA